MREKALAMRQKSGKNQKEFWGLVGATQSAGSRFESEKSPASRKIPKSIKLLLLALDAGVLLEDDLKKLHKKINKTSKK